MKIIKLAIRSILSFRTYSGINLLGLALSLACVITIFRYVYGELTVDRFNKNLDRIYLTTAEMRSRPGEALFSGVITLRGTQPIANPSEHPGVEMVSHFTRFDIDEIDVDDRKYNAIIVASDSNFLKLTGFPLALGTGKLTELNSALITQAFAKKLFGNENPIGKSFRHSTGALLTITGVVRQTATKSTLSFDLVMSSDFSFSSMPSPNTLVMLYPGVDYRTINKQYEDFIESPYWGQHIRYHLFPLSKVYFDKSIQNYMFRQGNYRYVSILIAVGVLIFLVGVINYINIYTVIVLRRGRELGVKKVFGAARHNIFVQLLSENVLMTGVALLVALFIAWITYPFITNVLQLDQIPNLGFDLQLSFGILFALPFLTTLYPFFRHHYSMPVQSLRNFDWIRGGSLRRLFLSFQYVITIIMLVVSLFFVKQLRFMLDADPGYRTEDIIKVQFLKETGRGVIRDMEEWQAKRDKENRIADEFVQKMNACPLFTGWTYGQYSPNNFREGGGVQFKLPEGEYMKIGYTFASASWLKLFAIPLIEGRLWDDKIDSYYDYSLIVTESVLKLYGITDFKEALLQPERRLWMSSLRPAEEMKTNPPYRIVGVVKDFDYLHLSKKSEPMAFSCSEGGRYEPLMAAITPGRTQDAIVFLRQLHDETAGGEFTYSFVADEIQEMYNEDKKIAAIYAVFTFIAIFVSALGLFSMSLFDIQQRRKEIAIRKINGATIADVIRLLLKKYFWSLVISFALAAPVALFAINRYLEDFAHKAPVSWWLFAAAITLTAGISLLTLIYQTQKAANQNPAETISKG